MDEKQPIVVNLPQGEKQLTFMQGQAPKQLDDLAPIKVDIKGTIYAPLNWLDKRVKDIDQHKAYLLVNRDDLSIKLTFNEDDPYKQGNVEGTLSYSNIFLKFGINSGKQWQPEKLGQFLKLYRTYFTSREENMKCVSALKNFQGKVNQDVERLSKENGDRGLQFRQSVNSNIPESFKVKMPIFKGQDPVEFVVETYASIDGADVTIALQSAGANDNVEEAKANTIDDVVNKIREIAPDLAIMEQ